jgi:hypothetical protein
LSNSQVFDHTCLLVAEETGLTEQDARRALLGAVTTSRQDPDQVGREEMRFIVRSTLPAELERRGVGDPLRACGAVGEALGRLEASDASPYEIFFRLG